MFYLLILCLFIVVISRLLAYANQGADRGKLLHVALPEYTVMPDIHVKADGNEGSEITSFIIDQIKTDYVNARDCLLYTSPSPRDLSTSRMPSSA